MNILKCFILAVCILFSSYVGVAGAQDDVVDEEGGITISWDANTESDLKGYKVYVGLEPDNYVSSVDVGNITRYTIRDLTIGTRYYIAVTASDNWGNESATSDETSAEAKDIITPDKPTNVREVTTAVNNN